MFFSSFAGGVEARTGSDGGTGIGNGGDSVVCSNGKEEMLDTFELRVFGGRHPVLSSVPDFKAKVEDVLNRLSPLSPLRAKAFRARFAELLRNTSFVESDLPDVPDSQHSLIPIGCEVKQIVIQTRANGQVFLTVNRPLWDRLDEENRAALYLHELSYAEAIDRGAVNSIAARRFNGVLLSLPTEVTEFAQRVGDKPNSYSTFPMEIALPGGDILFVNQFHREEFEAAHSASPEFTSKSACGVYFPRFAAPLDVCRNGVPVPYQDPLVANVKNGKILSFWPAYPESSIMDGAQVGVNGPIRGFDFLEGKLWSARTILVPVAGRNIPCTAVTFDPSAVLADRSFKFDVNLVDSCRPNADYDAPDDKVTFQFLPGVARDDVDFVSFTRDKSQPSRPVVGFSVEPYRFSPGGTRHYINYPDIPTDGGVLTNLAWGRIDEDYQKNTATIGDFYESNYSQGLSQLKRSSETCQLDGPTTLSWQGGTLKLTSALFSYCDHSR
ncbi:MAG: hypothetical protein ACXWP1_03965 [Bdellovibrionota bacterium]